MLSHGSKFALPHLLATTYFTSLGFFIHFFYSFIPTSSQFVTILLLLYIHTVYVLYVSFHPFLINTISIRNTTFPDYTLRPFILAPSLYMSVVLSRLQRDGLYLLLSSSVLGMGTQSQTRPPFFHGMWMCPHYAACMKKNPCIVVISWWRDSAIVIAPDGGGVGC